MPRLKKRTVIAAKFEAVSGTFDDPSEATDVLFLVQDVSYKPNVRIIERNFLGPSFARKGPQTVADRFVTITFTTEIMGAGAAGSEPKWARFLKCAGFSTTVNAGTNVEYNPVVPPALSYDATGANGNTTLSMQVHVDGVAKAARGCVGNATLRAEAGSPGFIDWEFTGIYQAVADISFPGLSTGFDNQVPPILESAAFSFHSLAGSVLLFKTINIELGNVVVPRWDANSATGIRSLMLVDRDTRATVDPEQATKADWTTEGTERLMNGTVGAFTCTFGTAAGNKLTFSAPANLAQIVDLSEGERDQILTNQMQFQFLNAMQETTQDIRLTVL